MALTLSYVNLSRTGVSLNASVERVSDGFFYDASDSTFKALADITGTNWRVTLTEGTTIQLGSWTGSIASTPVAQFSNGRYRVRVHNAADSDKTVVGGDVFMHEGDEVDVDADILDTAGYDSAATINLKLGSYSGASGDNNNVRDDIAASGANNIALSVLAGEFQVTADIGTTGSSISKSFSLPAKREHRKKWSFTIKKLDGTAINLASTKVRFFVQDVAGQASTTRIDYNSTDNPTRVNITDAANGKFEVILFDTDTDLSETGGDGTGIYYAEFLWDELSNGQYQLLAAGDLVIEKGADLLVG